ncbi:MAG: hypothetical protein AAGF85_14315 [Bacteroidota bacterium]
MCLVIITLVACTSNKIDENQPFDKTKIIEEVTSAVWAFHAADTARNAQQVIDLLWPESNMMVDGNRIPYSDLAAGSRKFMSSIVLFHTDWKDLKVVPVSSTAAVASFIFNDSIIHKSGEVTISHGPNTFVWQKRADEWKVLFGDADHYASNSDIFTH